MPRRRDEDEDLDDDLEEEDEELEEEDEDQGSRRGGKQRRSDAAEEDEDEVELESQMKVVTVKSTEISDTYTTSTPHRDAWEEGNPGSWGTSPLHQPGTPPARPYEAPTPGSGWANTPGGNYNEAGTPRESSPAYASAPSPYVPSTPGGQPMTPSSASYLPGTPGGQPMTPDSGGLDFMSPSIGGEGDGLWFLPDILVTVRRSGEDPVIGVVREVLPDGSCKVSIGSSRELATIPPAEMEFVKPRKSDKIKIMSGGQRGATGKLIGVDNNDGIVKIVKVDGTHDVKILDMTILAKLAQ